jgi:PTH1 family peptidyl-tRNA hydrolase
VWVVVGLGNPGTRYRLTRHNVGFRVIDRLAARFGVSVARAAHRALVGEARHDGKRVLLVKPQTYMNDSGAAAASLQRFYRFKPAHLVAVYDDVDLATGRLRVRAGGGPGGHRGIESLITTLDDRSFLRVKVGVGRPPVGRDTADYVLGVPGSEEARVLEDAEERAADAVELLFAEGPERAMNRINQKEAPHGGSPL